MKVWDGMNRVSDWLKSVSDTIGGIHISPIETESNVKIDFKSFIPVALIILAVIFIAKKVKF